MEYNEFWYFLLQLEQLMIPSFHFTGNLSLDDVLLKLFTEQETRDNLVRG